MNVKTNENAIEAFQAFPASISRPDKLILNNEGTARFNSFQKPGNIGK